MPIIPASIDCFHIILAKNIYAHLKRLHIYTTFPKKNINFAIAYALC